MNNKLLSVCLITYNHEKYIRQAIDSILSQQVDFEWELIIADDYSTDGTRDIILEYHLKYPDLIKLIFQKQNVGPARNWIDLISMPSSKYIAYLEGDDYWVDSYKLQKQVDFLEKNSDTLLCFAYTILVNSKDEVISNTNLALTSKTLTILDFLKGNPAGTNTCTSLFRREGIKNLNWFLDKPIGDQFLWAMLTQEKEAIILPFYGGAYRIQSHGAWSRLNAEEVYYKKIEILGILREQYSNNYKNRLTIDLQQAKLMIQRKIDNKEVKPIDILFYVVKHKFSALELWKSRNLIKQAVYSWLSF